MKSTIKVEFVDKAGLDGFEPVIVVNLSRDIEDVRDRLLKAFFEQLGGQSELLNVKYDSCADNHTRIHITPVRPEPIRVFTEAEIQRRNRIDLMHPAELSIRNAVQEIEKLPASVLLTEAVILLGRAKDLVADFIDTASVDNG